MMDGEREKEVKDNEGRTPRETETEESILGTQEEKVCAM